MINNTPLRILHLTFDLALQARQIHQWRGAFIEMSNRKQSTLHNHKSDTEYHHRYPLVHYRSWKGRASITAFNEGVEEVQAALANNEWEIRWQGREKHIQIEDIKLQEHYLRMLPEQKEYKLFNWLALSQENYKKWKACKNLIERAALLEKILASQIQYFCTSMGWTITEEIKVNLLNIYATKTLRMHGNPMLAFNVNYNVNILLPTGMALGRGVSVGCGWQLPLRTKFTPKQDESVELRQEVE